MDKPNCSTTLAFLLLMLSLAPTAGSRGHFKIFKGNKCMGVTTLQVFGTQSVISCSVVCFSTNRTMVGFNFNIYDMSCSCFTWYNKSISLQPDESFSCVRKVCIHLGSIKKSKPKNLYRITNLHQTQGWKFIKFLTGPPSNC